jgi:hypothetical protein
MKGGMLVAIRALIPAIAAATAAFVKFLAVLAPIVAKIALVVAVVRGVIKAVQEVVPELEGFQMIMDTLSGVVDTVKNALGGFFGTMEGGLDVLGAFLVIVNNTAKILVSGLAGAINTAALAWLKFKQAVIDSDEEAAETQKTINALVRDMDKLASGIVTAGSEIAGVFTGTAMGAVKTESKAVLNLVGDINTRLSDMGKSAHDGASEASSALKQLVSENASLQLQIDNMGATQAEVIENNLAHAMENLKLKEEEFKAEGKLTAAVQKAIDKQKELLGLQAAKQLGALSDEQTAKAMENVTRLTNMNRQFAIEQLTAQNDLVSAQIIKNEMALEAFDAEIAKMEEQNALTEEQIGLIDERKNKTRSPRSK